MRRYISTLVIMAVALLMAADVQSILAAGGPPPGRGKGGKGGGQPPAERTLGRIVPGTESYKEITYPDQVVKWWAWYDGLTPVTVMAEEDMVFPVSYLPGIAFDADGDLLFDDTLLSDGISKDIPFNDTIFLPMAAFRQPGLPPDFDESSIVLILDGVNVFETWTEFGVGDFLIDDTDGITDTVGYWLMVKALPMGEHTLTVEATVGGTSYEVQYTLNVIRNNGR